MFEPFFTTKPTGMGTGLGLSQVHGFIKQSGGHLRIYSEVGVGTTVKLYLPRSTGRRPIGPSPARRAAGARRGADVTVLVVEDEAGVRDFAVEALGELGYDVIARRRRRGGAGAARRPSGSRPAADRRRDAGDQRPACSPTRRCAARPALKVVFMTGYTRNAIVHNGVLDAGAHLVSKPFTVAQLGAELEAALVDEVKP